MVERIWVPSNEQSNAINAAADKDCTRQMMAEFYADCMRCDRLHPGSIDWPAIGRAILDRWSRSGFLWIKRLAHQRLQNSTP